MKLPVANRGPKVRSIKVPPGTKWFGGPINQCSASLRISGPDLDPAKISQALGCMPSSVSRGRKATSTWIFSIDSKETGITDVEALILELLSRISAKPSVLKRLAKRYQVDIFCGIFLDTSNRGFELGPDICRKLADRSIKVGFDIYAAE